MQLSPVLPKSQMTEEDIKLHYITPAIKAKWNDMITTDQTGFAEGNNTQCFLSKTWKPQD